MHQSLRSFGKETSLWTLDLPAEVSFSEKVVECLVSGEAVRVTLKRFDISGKRAKQKPEWVFGYEDET